MKIQFCYHPISMWAQNLSAGRRLIFPVTLWWFATFYLGGDLGKYLDDYIFAWRDPVTGLVGNLTSPFRGFFWRPLHLLTTNVLGTVFWHHDWGLHLLGALVHGGVTFAVWSLLRRLSIRSSSATIPALLFLCMPLHYEVVFWPAALSTGLAMALGLVAFHLALRPAGQADFQVGALLFASACFNEQPAAAVAALPFFHLAALPTHQSLIQRWSWSVLRSLPGFFGVGLYVALLIGTAPTHVRGGSQSLVGWNEVLTRLHQFASTLGQTLSQRATHTIGGGLHSGWRELAVFPGKLVMLVMTALAALWLISWLRQPPDPSSIRPSTKYVPPRRAAFILFALALQMAAWAPIVLVKNQTLPSRIFYFPNLALALLAGLLIDLMTEIAARRGVDKIFRTILGVAGVTLVLLGAISMVGQQVAFRERSKADLRLVKSLVSAMPEPPPQTVFMPLGDAYAPLRTQYSRFDRGLLGCFRFEWSATSLLQHTYRRDDVFATHVKSYGELPFPEFNASGVRFRKRIWGFEPHPTGGIHINWSQIVPFAINRKGRIIFANKIILAGLQGENRSLDENKPEGEEFVIDFPLVGTYRSQSQLTTATFLIDLSADKISTQRLKKR